VLRQLLALVVFDQQARHGRAECLLARFERETHARARFLLLAALRQRENAVERVPELRHRRGQIAALIAGGACECGFARQGVHQIVADAVELGLPGGERIRLDGIQHVAHCERHGIQVVLDAKQQ